MNKDNTRGIKIIKNNLGNMIIAQSGMINGTECSESIYLEVSILVPSDQYKCVTTGVDTLYFLYKMILISGKCQSYCSLYTISDRQLDISENLDQISIINDAYGVINGVLNLN